MAAIHIDFQQWAPRSVQQPKTERLADGGLRLQAAGRDEVFGGFRGKIAPLEPDHWYRVTVHAQLRGIDDPRHQTWVQLQLSQQHYRHLADVVPGSHGECRYEMTGKAELDHAFLDVLLTRCPDGEMTVSKVVVEPLDAPPVRLVRVCSIYDYPPYRPKDKPIDNARLFAADIDRARERFGPLDLVVLPEAINIVGITEKHHQGALDVPGPETEVLADAASRCKTYVVAGLFQRDGDVIYNAAVLFDRGGQIAGIYHKVQLPNQELSDGIKPGGDLPVFDTDFGRLGMLICHDTTYPEPARALLLGGAEIVAVPIWGGREVLVRSRAYENGLWLVTSGYNYPCQIIDPKGDVIARTHPGDGARGERDAIYATLDLAHPPIQPWYGDMRDLQFKERRDELYGHLLGTQAAALPRWRKRNQTP
ncbi:MAG TPA: carbon-nitrogen hydrolase family protein [Phycisphaerae bacterium]|nr:carbon-nitrogen hydrolase family protein [Phycisphaerae bacterium]